ncbi:MAG: hypothetical protein Q7R43_05420 [Candidatus Daviesbacteria bacterium]|nr:hypothetical protein [Candidatus Daviesbacteria bacterium]
MKSPDTRYFAGIRYPVDETKEAYQKYLESVAQKREIEMQGRLRWSKVVPLIPRALCLAGAGASLTVGYISLQRFMPSVDLSTALDMIAQRNGQGALFLPAIASALFASYLTHLTLKDKE